MPTKIKSNNRQKYQLSSPAQIPPQLLVAGGKAAIGSLGGAYTNIKDVTQSDEFKEKGFFGKAGSIIGAGLKGQLGGISQALIGNDFGLLADGEQQDPTAAQPDVSAQETAMRLQRLESMQAAPTLMYGAPFLMNKPGSPMAKFGIGTNFKLKK